MVSVEGSAKSDESSSSGFRHCLPGIQQDVMEHLTDLARINLGPIPNGDSSHKDHRARRIEIWVQVIRQLLKKRA